MAAAVGSSENTTSSFEERKKRTRLILPSSHSPSSSSSAMKSSILLPAWETKGEEKFFLHSLGSRSQEREFSPLAQRGHPDRCWFLHPFFSFFIHPHASERAHYHHSSLCFWGRKQWVEQGSGSRGSFSLAANSAAQQVNRGGRERITLDHNGHIQHCDAGNTFGYTWLPGRISRALYFCSKYERFRERTLYEY